LVGQDHSPPRATLGALAVAAALIVGFVLDAWRRPDTRRSCQSPSNSRRSYPVIWIHFVSYFFGGVFLANAIPHLVSGQMGRPFPSPFAKPPGEGLSSSRVNVLWGSFNLAVAYELLCQVGNFEMHSLADVAATAAGGLLISIVSAGHFGRFHGGNDPA
jgi:hypothetical protein